MAYREEVIVRQSRRGGRDEGWNGRSGVGRRESRDRGALERQEKGVMS